MREDDCYQVGEVIKTHGLRGEVNVLLDVDYPEEYQNLESVFLKQEDKLVPFFIDTLQMHGNTALVKFEDIDDIEQAKEIVKTKLFLPLSLLPALEEGDYYYHDLVGCLVYEKDREIGEVKSVYDLSGNELMEVTLKEGSETLIPLNDELLIKVDIANKRIDVSLPEGLLNL